MISQITPMLSKFRFIAGLQCPLRLWHQCYNPKLAKSPSPVQQALFEASHEDGELVFVIGHEIGHVVENHIKEKLRLAYAGSAVRKAIASQQNEVGDIARSAVGALTESLLNAQFSQQEEREADDFGVMFLKQKGYDIQPAISALMKLAALGGNHSFLSSHPAPAKRAKRLQHNILTAEQVEDPSLLSRIVDWLKSHWPFIEWGRKNHA